MKLYTMAGTCALSVHISLEWIGAPYQLQVMARGDHKKPDYLTINPRGEVPAVTLDDGRALTQAAAILAWLAESHPESGLWASNDPLERFALNELLAYLTSEVHVAFGPYFAPSRYLDDESHFDALKTKALEQVAVHMTSLNDRLGHREHILFNKRTVADAYLYVLTRWADNLAAGIKPYSNLANFRAAMEGDPGVAAALKAQGMKPLGLG